MALAKNSKSEYRNPKQARNPKSKTPRSVTNTIKFDILNGIATIDFLPNSGGALPAIDNNSVTIDGRPPVARPNQIVRLDGINLVNGDGLWIKKSGCIIQGLEVINFPGDGILIDGAAGTKIGAAGGADVRMVINGNDGSGIRIQGLAAAGCIVVNSYVGIDRAGTVGISNGADGITVEDHANATIGDYNTL